MNNIHILPTLQASEYFINKEGILSESYSLKRGGAVHFYITNDEEIKEGDWLFANEGANKIVEIKEGAYPYGSINKNGDKIFNSKHWKSKIILTTDQDLIKDGVQPIDDEFLEWFVKNPSCDEVKIHLIPYDGTKSIDKYWSGEYKIIIPKEEQLYRLIKEYPNSKPLGSILKNSELEVCNWDEYYEIIPKEEPKQRLEKYSERFDNDKSPIGNTETWGKRIVNEEPNIIDQWLEKNGNPEISKQVEKEAEELSKQETTLEEPCVQCCGTGEIQKSTNRKQSNFECDICNGRGYWNKVIELKQETIEEAGVAYAKTVNQNHTSHMLGFYNGAKWQQERSEEDLKTAFLDGWELRDGDLPFPKAKKKWFEQFKKK